MFQNIQSRLKGLQKSTWWGGATTSNACLHVNSPTTTETLMEESAHAAYYKYRDSFEYEEMYMEREKQAREKARRLQASVLFTRIHELPIEIREYIWQYAMQDEVSRRKRKGGGVYANREPNLVIALKGNKKMYQEALVPFYKMNQFELGPWTYFELWKRPSKFSYIQNLSINLSTLENLDEWSTGFIDLFRAFAERSPSSLGLATHLRNVSIVVKLADQGEVYHYERVIQRLLQQSRQLQMLEVTLRDMSFEYCHHSLEEDAAMTTTRLPWFVGLFINQINRRSGVKGLLYKCEEGRNNDWRYGSMQHPYSLMKCVWKAEEGDHMQSNAIGDPPSYLMAIFPASKPVIVNVITTG